MAGRALIKFDCGKLMRIIKERIMELNTSFEIKAPAPDPIEKCDTKDFDKSQCGWVSKKGKFIPCSWGDHEDVADNIADIYEGGYKPLLLSDTSAQFIERRGWIRISDGSPLIPDNAYKNDDHVWKIPCIQYSVIYHLYETYHPGKASRDLAIFVFQLY